MSNLPHQILSSYGKCFFMHVFCLFPFLLSWELGHLEMLSKISRYNIHTNSLSMPYTHTMYFEQNPHASHLSAHTSTSTVLLPALCLLSLNNLCDAYIMMAMGAIHWSVVDLGPGASPLRKLALPEAIDCQ